MDFCTVGLNELQPDMICPNCRVGIDAYPNEYETVQSLGMIRDNKWDIKCPNCGHKFQAVPGVEIRWYIVQPP